ncbi:hypothetical protein GQ54DRAFT_104750 [Martensiomyces pterosporus]|nr:hypothetical protein GQ54DRAFT_104750 [Martensiomyces pterosporus]
MMARTSSPPAVTIGATMIVVMLDDVPTSALSPLALSIVGGGGSSVVIVTPGRVSVMTTMLLLLLAAVEVGVGVVSVVTGERVFVGVSVGCVEVVPFVDVTVTKLVEVSSPPLSVVGVLVGESVVGVVRVLLVREVGVLLVLERVGVVVELGCDVVVALVGVVVVSVLPVVPVVSFPALSGVFCRGCTGKAALERPTAAGMPSAAFSPPRPAASKRLCSVLLWLGLAALAHSAEVASTQHTVDVSFMAKYGKRQK